MAFSASKNVFRCCSSWGGSFVQAVLWGDKKRVNNKKVIILFMMLCMKYPCQFSNVSYVSVILICSV